MGSHAPSLPTSPLECVQQAGEVLGEGRGRSRSSNPLYSSALGVETVQAQLYLSMFEDCLFFMKVF